MNLLPIFLNINNRKCLVVGGGEVALRKASLLLRAGANLEVVTESASPELTALCQTHHSAITLKSFEASDLDGAELVIAATDNLEVNALVSKHAQLRQLPVNVVDQPALCTFIMPAVVDRTPIVIAISSSGSSPVLTRKLKELIETVVPQRVDKLAALLGSFRSRVKERIPSFKDRMSFWETALDSTVTELVYSGQDTAAEAELNKQLESYQENLAVTGEVYLVGAGPGDPDLLTLRALRLMQKADVVLYDRLVSPQVMAKLRPDAEKIHVGKQRSLHTVAQETINDMLVRLAQEGKRVLRLKGGDPFIFGRGGEELATLAAAGIPFQVVPGITAASGCAAYAGIPLTHRDYAQSVRFLTGHLKQGELKLDWELLVKEQQTLVFYMGLVGLQTICEQLIKHGMDPELPAAVVQQGTTDNQKVVVGTVTNLHTLAIEHQLVAPTLIIIGRVVSLRRDLAWFN